MHQLVWLRNDLRTADNSALTQAMHNGSTVALYVLSPKQWQLHNDAPIKINFQLRNLQALAQHLAKLNVPLLLLKCDEWRDIPNHLVQLCQQHAIQQVHFNECYGVNEQLRDQQSAHVLQAAGISVNTYTDRVLFPPGSVLNQKGEMFRVFTAFKKACWQRLRTTHVASLPEPKPQPPLTIPCQAEQLKAYLAHTPQEFLQWPAGERYAHTQLNEFCAQDLAVYHERRDFPAINGTSQLSPYLASGVLSVRQCWNAAAQTNYGEFDTGNQGVVTWLTELLWREFYLHLLALNPRLSCGEPFLEHTQAIQWRNSEADLLAWQQGRTGFPLIDAAMRQLLATGWMHNRLRMVTAMFFSKNLLLDWRLGERWFMQHLIDGDLAANNGGWQWCASTGTDAAPYFRVFNPVTQSERFDPQGEFTRRWVPELAHLSKAEIHWPKHTKGLDYPAPIVDLKASRLRAIEAFKRLH